MNLESKDPRHMPRPALLRYQRRIHLKDDVVEGRAEVGAVDGGVAGCLGVVDVLAFGAVHLYGFLVGEVGLAHGQEGVGVAEDAGAFAEIGFFVFVELEGQGRGAVRNGVGGGGLGLSGLGRTYHFCKTASRDDVAGVHEAVQMPGGFLDRFSHLVVAVEIEDIVD